MGSNLELKLVADGFLHFLKDQNQPMDKLTTRNLLNLYNLIFKIEFERNKNTSLSGLTYEDLERYMVDEGYMRVEGPRAIFLQK